MIIDNASAPAILLICSAKKDIFSEVASRLESTGHSLSLQHVSNPNDASKYLNTHYPAIVFIDESFASNGFEFCRRIRSLRGYSQQPVIMLLEETTSESIEQVRLCGASDFDSHDAAYNALRFRVEQLLKHSQSRQSPTELVEYVDNRHIDSLTGLLNRQHFHVSFEHSLSMALKDGRNGAVLLIDIDDFKRINSSFDYQTGDYLLKLVAKRLASVVRENDILMRETLNPIPKKTLARFGGDEFTLFIDDICAEGDVSTIVNRCLECISAPIVLDGHEIVLQASVGIALFSQDGIDVSTLLRNAERAMYVSKGKSGSCFTYYNEQMECAAQTRFLLESELRKGIENGQFTLNYQPLVNAKSGLISSMEALCRWNHPELGMVPPDTFIPLAEETGLILTLGNWVLKQVCVQIGDWLDQDLAVGRIAINVSAFQFNQTDFVSNLRQILAETKIDASHIELELTESIIMRDVEENILKLNELKSLGVTLAVDDFGTGYSSLSYLKKLPIDTLKIDRSFISNITTNSADMAIVEAILALAEKLHLLVVAEGVEEQGQLEFLQERQCQLLQGYLFSPAKPAKEVCNLFGTYEEHVVGVVSQLSIVN
jgi:diguanylate cyclase (GGDEF)-like protein